MCLVQMWGLSKGPSHAMTVKPPKCNDFHHKTGKIAHGQFGAQNGILINPKWKPKTSPPPTPNPPPQKKKKESGGPQPQRVSSTTSIRMSVPLVSDLRATARPNPRKSKRRRKGGSLKREKENSPRGNRPEWLFPNLSGVGSLSSHKRNSPQGALQNTKLQFIPKTSSPSDWRGGRGPLDFSTTHNKRNSRS